MVSGLVITSKNCFNLQFENLKLIEDFEQLNLRKKYGFKLGWYNFGQNIHVILKELNAGEKQIYLAEKTIEAESILNKLVNELSEQFQISSKDQKEIFNLLKEHGCCFF